MKILLTLSLLLAATISRADDEKRAPTPCRKTSEPLTIDGKLDEDCWQQAHPFRVDYMDQRKASPKLDETPRMIAKYCWDANYLYIGYEVFDKNLRAQGEGAPQGPAGRERTPAVAGWGDNDDLDVVEFFISFGDKQFFWEIHHNAQNHFADIWCAVFDKQNPIYHSKMSVWGHSFAREEFIRDYHGHGVKTAVQLKPQADGAPSTVNQTDDTDTGYTAEIRLPLGSLTTPKKAEVFVETAEKDAHGRPIKKSVGFDLTPYEAQVLAVIQVGEDKLRYRHSSPTRKGGWFHASVDQWNRLAFTSPPR